MPGTTAEVVETKPADGQPRVLATRIQETTPPSFATEFFGTFPGIYEIRKLISFGRWLKDIADTPATSDHF